MISVSRQARFFDDVGESEQGAVSLQIKVVSVRAADALSALANCLA